MSEQAPQMSRIDQLHANRAVAEEAEKEAERTRLEDEQTNFEDALYDDAGTTDLSEEAEQRINEADAYQEHLAKMAERPSLDYSNPENAALARRNTEDFEALNEQSTYAAEREQKVMDAALDAKFASDPKLRRLDRVSKEVHELRSELAAASDDPDLKTKLENREAALGELLSDYSKSDDYDEALIQAFVWRDDMAALDVASENAFRTKNEHEATETKVEDAEKASEEPVVEVEAEEAEKPEVADEVRAGEEGYIQDYDEAKDMAHEWDEKRDASVKDLTDKGFVNEPDNDAPRATGDVSLATS